MRPHCIGNGTASIGSGGRCFRRWLLEVGGVVSWAAKRWCCGSLDAAAVVPVPVPMRKQCLRVCVRVRVCVRAWVVCACGQFANVCTRGLMYINQSARAALRQVEIDDAHSVEIYDCICTRTCTHSTTDIICEFRESAPYRMCSAYMFTITFFLFFRIFGRHTRY